ncbi:hypothetical protein N9F50_02030 [Akkermansiaceae bacterium]|nr:hypothetical protein [Akkermansiaceae bacterium]
MKRIAPIAAAWIASCSAAYYLGSQTSDTATAKNLTSNDRSTVFRTNDRSRNREVSSSAARAISERKNGNSSSSKNVGDQIIELSKISDPIERTQALLALVDRLSPEEFQEVVASFRGMGNVRERMGEYAILLTAWAKTDPVSALEYTQENTGTPFARQTVLGTWAKTQPEAAIAWARNNYEGTEGNKANPWLVGIIKGISQSDVTRATALLEELPFSNGRGEALGFVLNELRSQGGDAAQQWIAGLSDERLRDGAAARLAGKLGEDDPAEALAWAATISEQALKYSAADVVEGWAAKNPSSAQAWVDQQPEEIRSKAGRGFIDAIAGDDPQTASEWLTPYAGNPAYDDAIRELIYSTAEKDPAMSGGWIMNLSSERDQTRTFHRALRGMMGSNADATMDFINSTETLPDGIRQRATVYYEEQNK